MSDSEAIVAKLMAKYPTPTDVLRAGGTIVITMDGDDVAFVAELISPLDGLESCYTMGCTSGRTAAEAVTGLYSGMLIS